MPLLPEEYFESGLAALRERKPHRTLRNMDEAEKLGFDARRCAELRWQCWMLLGDFEAAWRENDAIRKSGARGEHELWDGDPFDNKRVVIRCLQDYGDAIQFLRYAGALSQRASRVAVQTHAEMVELVARIEGVDAVGSGEKDFPREAWDQQIEVTELPRAFRTLAGTIPVRNPYIRLEKEPVALSREKLGGSGGRKVGLLWAASPWSRARCLRLAELRPLLEVGDIDFYSFQRGEERSELQELSEFRVHDTAEHSPEIVDTAADLMHMDLLITVDTMAAHLAGALGRPVWTLLPFEADWRWMLGCTDTPWYPTMRLFRQERAGEWGPVVAEVVGALKRAES